MTNKELQIILRLRDEASKRLEGIRGHLQRFANAWRKNWLAITAAITGAIIAVRKAWDLMSLGAKAEQQASAFKNLADAFGADSARIVADMKRLSGETLSTSQAMEKASQAMILGIEPDKLGKLMEISRASARAFGKDVDFMFESIVTGIGRQSKLILDNLGIIVSAKEAYAKYAASIGKTVKQLTEQERKQAFLNATMEAGERILAQIDTSTMTSYEKMQKLKAGWKDFSEQIGRALIQVAGFMQALSEHIVSGLFTLLEAGTNVFQKLLIPLQKFYELLSHLPGQFGEVYAEAARGIDELSQKMEENKNVFQLAAADSAKAAMEQYDLVFAKAKQTGDQTADVLKNAMQHVGEQAEVAQTSFNAMEELAKQSASNIQNAFADFFFDAFTERTQGIMDVLKSFGMAMLRTISNIMASALVAYAILGPLEKLFPGTSSLLKIASRFHQGGLVPSYHGGGMVRAHGGYLARDEVPIIAQAGEGVISRRGMQAVGGAPALNRLNRGEPARGGETTIHNYYIQATDVDSFRRLMNKNGDLIDGRLIKGMQGNNPIRHATRKYC